MKKTKTTNKETQLQLEQGKILLLMTSCKKYDQIRVLSLRDLQLTSVFRHIWHRCHNLQLLFLGGNNITSKDIGGFMNKMPQLVKVDLSSNNLRYFPRDADFFEQLINLEVLILEDNLLESMHELQGLSKASGLKHIILAENPVAQVGTLFSKWDTTYRFELLQLIPQLKAIDYNVCTDDERLCVAGCQSIRFRSMNTFSRFKFEIFPTEMSANAHITAHASHVQMLQDLSNENSAIVKIQRNFRGHSIRRVVTRLLRARRRSATKIQAAYRGWRARVKMEIDMVNYMRSVGLQHLTMNNEQRRMYESSLFLFVKIVPKIRRWRQRFREKKYRTKVLSYLRMYVVKEGLSWALDKPLDLRRNQGFLILKEQKYLFLRIMKSQKAIEPKLTEHLCQLFEDVPDWELMADVDFDSFQMPELPILQMTKPSSFIKIKEKQKDSIFETIKEPLGKFFLKCCGRASKENDMDIENDYRQLINLRLVYKNASAAERDAFNRYIKPRDNNHEDEEDHSQGAKKHQQSYRFGKIVGQRHGSDFLRFNLGLSGEIEVASKSHILVLQVLRALISWNKRMPENSVLILFPELLQRQINAFKIQSAFRAHKRRQMLLREWNEMEQAQKESFTIEPNQFTLLKCLKYRRAAIIIQQYWSMYRLKRRIKILSQLRIHLRGVTDKTLYMEENLYIHLQSIQFNCLHNPTIPDVDSFAFDFCESFQTSGVDSFQEWNLCFTEDYKVYNSAPCQTRYQVMATRLNEICVPNWVVDDDSGVNQRYQMVNMASEDRNDPMAIVHKNSGQINAKVQDYQQIVLAEERLFSMNRGLRFVTIECPSIQDAKRRSLAMALMTLNRKTNSFLKLTTKSQMIQSTFLSNIGSWWQIAQIPGLGPDHLSRLLKVGESSLPLPRDISESHSGLIITKKDLNRQFTADQAVTLVERVERRIAYEVNCHEIGPKPQYLETSTRTVIELENAYAEQQLLVGRVTIEQKRFSDRHGESSSQVSVPSESIVNMSMLNMLPKVTRNENDERVSTALLETLKTSQNMSPSKSPGQQKPHVALKKSQKNHYESADCIPTNKQIDEVSDRLATLSSMENEPELTVKDGIQYGSKAILNTNSQLKKLQAPKQSHAHAINNPNDPYIDQSGIPASVPNLQKLKQNYMASKSTIERGRSTTTKEETVTRESQAQSLEEIGVKVIDKLYRDPQGRKSYNRFAAMTNTQFRHQNATMGQQRVPVRNVQTAKGMYRRPLTSKNPTGYVIYNGQQSQQHSVRLAHDSSYPSTAQDTYRIKSAVFGSKDAVRPHTRKLARLQDRATTAQLTTVTVESRETLEKTGRTGTAMSGVHTRSVQDLNQLDKMALFRKSIDQQSEKSIAVHKQLAVQKILKEAIRTEKDAKLRLINQLGRLERHQNNITIQENKAHFQVEKFSKKQVRAQSTHMKKSSQNVSRSHALQLGSLANTLNKVHHQKILANQKKLQLKAAQSSVKHVREQRVQSALGKGRDHSLRPGTATVHNVPAIQTYNTIGEQPHQTTEVMTYHPETYASISQHQSNSRHELQQVYFGGAMSASKTPFTVNTVNVEDSKRESSSKRSLMNKNTEIQQIFSQMHIPPRESRHHHQETKTISQNQTLEYFPYDAQNNPIAQDLQSVAPGQTEYNSQRNLHESNTQHQDPILQDMSMLDLSDHSQKPVHTYIIPQASSLQKLTNPKSSHSQNQRSTRSMNVDLHQDLKQKSQATTMRLSQLQNHPSNHQIYYQHLQGLVQRNSHGNTFVNEGQDSSKPTSSERLQRILNHNNHIQAPIMHPVPGDAGNSLTDALPVVAKEFKMPIKQVPKKSNSTAIKHSYREIQKIYP